MSRTDDYKMTYEEYLKSLGKVEIGDVYYFPLIYIGAGGTSIGGIGVVIGFDAKHENMPTFLTEHMSVIRQAEYNVLTRLKKVGHIDAIHEVLSSLEDLKRGDI